MYENVLARSGGLSAVRTDSRTSAPCFPFTSLVYPVTRVCGVGSILALNLKGPER